MTFDAIACYQQLMLAAGKKDFPPVPNTLNNALKDEKTRIVVTTAVVSIAPTGYHDTKLATRHRRHFYVSVHLDRVPPPP